MISQSFDLNFTPKSYFDDLSLEEKLGSKIKGQLRGEFVRNNIRTRQIDPKVFQSELDQDLKSAQSALHPWMMGGEYLPDLYENETEICRIVLKSTTMDVTSMRAQLRDDALHYRVVDEYNYSEFKLPLYSSFNPLSLGELIENINKCVEVTSDGAINDYGGEGLVRPYIFQQYECGDDLEDAVNFVTVHSVFYPQLNEFFERQKVLWYKELCEM